VEDVFFRWLSDGTKASVVDEDGNGYAYLGSLIYKLLPGGGMELESTIHGSGRIVVKPDPDFPEIPEARIYENQYYITDHLGSIRVVVNQEGEVLARNDYYPFGKPHNNPSLTAPATPEANRFLYNGKEKQLAGNLGLLDYGARMYDPEVARWFSIDPMAEQRNNQSPFNFVQNNPVVRIDPTGMIDDWYFNENGDFLGKDDKPTDNIRIMSQSSWDATVMGGQTINGDVGRISSRAFSKSGISDQAMLNVFQYFNNTGEKLGVYNDPKTYSGFMNAPIAFEETKNQEGAIVGAKVQSTSIGVNMIRQRNSGIFNDSNNIINAYVHEKKHITDAYANPLQHFTSTQEQREGSAIDAQMQSPTFEKTTPEFQQYVKEAKESLY
jgi:RHS repeat-associated protein